MNDRTAGDESRPTSLPSPPRVESTTGEFVTAMMPDYDGGREVTVFVPATAPSQIVFAGDGPWLSAWGRSLEGTVWQSTMIVAVHGLSDETSRLREYSPVFDANRFAAHEQFFVEDVRRWVGSRFGVSLPSGRTAVFGYSAGAELAIALGLRHPDVYGVVFAGSPGGGYKPSGKLPRSLPRLYLFGGTREPFFLDNAIRWAVALRRAGGDVVMRERNVSHGADPWRDEFPLMLTWAFEEH